MGTYVYSVRSKEHNVELLDGKKVVARPLSYLCKPYVLTYFNENANRHMDAMIARAGTNYEKKGIAEYVVLCDGKVKEGTPLYRWGRMRGITNDNLDDWAGTFVGYLTKKGRSWAVAPREEVELARREKKYKEMEEGTYSVGSYGNDWEAWKAFLESKDNGKPGSFCAYTEKYPGEE